MKKIYLFALIMALLAGCTPAVDSKNTAKAPGEIILEVTYEQGTKTQYSNIYVIWIENRESNFLQNIFICKKLVKGGLTGTALPFWKINRYPSSDRAEVDVVTGATMANRDFTVSAALKDKSIKKFEVYCEVDRYFDPNDWFSINQPALLYHASVDLDKPVNKYELKLCGWTPDELTENIIPGTAKGTLQKETRYITNFKTGNTFGGIDENRRSTSMVKKITLKIIR